MGLLDQARKAIRDKKVAVASELFTNIVTLTPKDTGQAIANWFIHEGTPIKKQLLFGPSSMMRSQAEGVALDRLNDMGTELQGDIFITNNIPYVPDLENGTSRQAPGGMVAVSVAAIVAKNK